jgi:hypothetical protein
MPKKWTTKESVYELIHQARKETVSKRDYSRCWLALMHLGVNNVDANEIMNYLDLADTNGKPYKS